MRAGCGRLVAAASRAALSAETVEELHVLDRTAVVAGWLAIGVACAGPVLWVYLEPLRRLRFRLRSIGAVEKDMRHVDAPDLDILAKPEHQPSSLLRITQHADFLARTAVRSCEDEEASLLALPRTWTWFP